MILSERRAEVVINAHNDFGYLNDQVVRDITNGLRPNTIDYRNTVFGKRYKYFIKKGTK